MLPMFSTSGALRFAFYAPEVLNIGRKYTQSTLYSGRSPTTYAVTKDVSNGQSFKLDASCNDYLN